MTSEGRGEMFEGDFVDKCAEKICSLLPMWGERLHQAYALHKRGARTPSGGSGITSVKKYIKNNDQNWKTENVSLNV